jgi:hypothetical protein
MRAHPVLALLLLLGSAAAAADAPALKPDVQRKLDKELADLRSAKDPVLQLTPLQHIVDLGPEAVQAALDDVWKLVDSPSPGLRKDALAAVRPPVKLAPDQVKRIDRMVADPDDQVRTAARKLLEEIRTFREQKASDQGMAAAEKLPSRQLLAELGSDDLNRRGKACQVTRKRIEEPGFRADVGDVPATVIALADHPDAQVRQIALALLTRCWKELPPEAMDAVVQATGDQDEAVAAAALGALAHAPASGRERAEAAARTQADKGSPQVQGAALTALAGLGVWDDSVAQVVKTGLQGDSPAVWKGACAAVIAARKRQPGLSDRLATIGNDAGADPEARAEALKALAIAADPAKSVPLLERLVENKNDDKHARIGACTALMLIAESAAPALTSLQGIAKNERDDLEVRKAAKAAAEIIAHH